MCCTPLNRPPAGWGALSLPSPKHTGSPGALPATTPAFCTRAVPAKESKQVTWQSVFSSFASISSPSLAAWREKCPPPVASYSTPTSHHSEKCNHLSSAVAGFTDFSKTSSQCKSASLASDFYLSLAEFNLESVPGPTPTLLFYLLWEGDNHLTDPRATGHSLLCGFISKKNGCIAINGTSILMDELSQHCLL